MKTQKLFIIILSIIFLSSNSYSQISIDGTVTNIDDQPSANVLVEIIDNNDTLNYYSTLTNSEGYFHISNITSIIKSYNNIPSSYLLVSNYPNPFNPSTIIYFELSKAEKIEIIIYDILGREVRTLYNEFHSAGVGELIWDGKNNYNQSVSAGVYLCQLRTKDNFKVHKMILLDGGSNVPTGRNFNFRKSNNNTLQKVNSRFDYFVRISGDSIPETFYYNLSCNQDTTLQLNVSKLIAKATIGAEGGTLEAEGIKLFVPIDAFSKNTELKLYSGIVDKPYRESAISDFYQINGLPSNYQKPLRMAIKYEGLLSNESFIAIGEEIAVKSLGEMTTTYCLLEASDSSGYLAVNLSAIQNGVPNSNNLEKLANFSNSLKAGAVTNFHSIVSKDNNFAVYGLVSDVTINNLNEIAEGCENAYQVFKNLNFSYDNRTKWPIPIFVQEIESWGFYSGSKILDENGYIVLNLKLFEDKDELPVTIGHEFLHLVQDLYDPRSWSIKIKDFGSRYWLDEATAIFAEEFFVDDPINYISSTFPPYLLSPFFGFHKEGKKAGDHGYGMASVIKYLSNNFQSATILNYYEDINVGKHPIEIIMNNADGSTDWIASFFRNYVEGKIYNVTTEYWVKSIHNNNKFTVKSNIDTLKNFDYLYPDLSGNLFIIDLDNPNWKANTNAFFTILGNENTDTEISVFKYKDADPNYFPQYISSNYSQVWVSNIEELTESGFDLMALITNARAVHPYTEKTEIYLQVDIKEPKDLVKNYTTAYIDLHVKGYNVRTTADTSYEDPYYEFYNTYAPEPTSVMVDSTFRSMWNYSRIDNFPAEGTVVTWTGSITVEFSKNFDRIKSYTETNAENWPGWRTTTMSVSVKDIPFYEGDSWSGDTYLLQVGEETCNNVSSRSYQLVWYDGKSVAFSRNECDEESYIEIKLYE